MDCTTALEAIQDAMDGRLGPAAATALDEHLAACPACAAERRAFSRLRDAIRSLPAEPAPAGFADAVLGGVRTAASRTGSHGSPSHGPSRGGRILRLRLALAAAAAVAAVVVVAVSSRPGDPHGDAGRAGTELAKNASRPADDPVRRAHEILDAAVTRGTDDAEAGRAESGEEAASGLSAGAGERPARHDTPAASPAAAPAASPAAAPAASPAGASKDKAGSRDRSAGADLREKVPGGPVPEIAERAATPAGDADADPGALAAAPRVVYAVFRTDGDARAFLDALHASPLGGPRSRDGRAAGGIAPPDVPPTGDGQRQGDEPKADTSKRGGSAGAAPRVPPPARPSPTVPAGGGDSDSDSGGLTAQGLGAERTPQPHREVGRVDLPAVSAEQSALLGRLAAAANGALAAEPPSAGARVPSDPPAPPGSAGPGTPPGLGPPAKEPPEKDRKDAGGIAGGDGVGGVAGGGGGSAAGARRPASSAPPAATTTVVVLVTDAAPPPASPVPDRTRR